jgi:hypothetical protein
LVVDEGRHTMALPGKILRRHAGGDRQAGKAIRLVVTSLGISGSWAKSLKVLLAAHKLDLVKLSTIRLIQQAAKTS